MEGTNCEYEAFQCFARSGADPSYVHVKELESGKRNLSDFDILFIPGGFSAGDYVRAGAIFAARIFASSQKDMHVFDESRKPIIGICNGFQVLVELGIIPGTGLRSERKVGLAFNSSDRFECRRTFVSIAGENRILGHRFSMKKRWEVPVAHSEGRIIFEDSEATYASMQKEGNILFRYVDDEGSFASYPWNPNGSYMNVAGMSNSYGNAIGMMPHPERIYYDYQSSCIDGETAGKAFFDSIIEYSRSV